MTTIVSIKAHCSADKEVMVDIRDGVTVSQQVIQDGESLEVYAYDNRVVRVFEKPKEK